MFLVERGALFAMKTVVDERAIRLFLVDDNPFLLESLAFLLERHGDFKIVGKSCEGRGLIAKLKRAKPDVVVLDVCLVDSDGLELLVHIREQLGIPVVMLSMYEEYRHYALVKGAFAYLTKGRDVEEFYRTLRLAAKETSMKE